MGMPTNIAPAIQVQALTKRYGKSRGVEDVSFQVERGEVFGFLGPNGAGKTTTIRLLLDLIRPNSGESRILGLDAHRDAIAVHRRIGYTPGDVEIYADLTGLQFLRLVAKARGLHGLGRGEELMARFQVEAHKPIRALSHGNRQKLVVVQAFLHDPELLLLDEPTEGLDPLMQQEFSRLVRETAEKGTTVFLSSHILSEV